MKRSKKCFVELRPTGNGAILYRTLARVLVRKELALAGAISEPANDCEQVSIAG